MAITPVMNYGIKGNYNISFAGKKSSNPARREEDIESSKKSGMNKAIPLAVLLAMSPLNSSNLNAAEKLLDDNKIEMVDDLANVDEIQETQGTVVREKKFRTNDGRVRTIQLISNNNDNVINSIRMPDMERPGKITELNDIKIVIMGDDKKERSNFRFSQISLLPDDAPNNNVLSHLQYSDKELTKYITDFANGKVDNDLKNEAFNVKHSSRILNFYKNGKLVRQFPRINLIEEGCKSHQSFGKLISTSNVSTSKGNYKIEKFNLDTNSNTFECVAVNLEDIDPAATFKVAGLKTTNVQFLDATGTIAKMPIKTVELYLRNSNETVNIFNEQLYDALSRLTKAPGYNNAFQIHPTTSQKIEVLKGANLNHLD